MNEEELYITRQIEKLGYTGDDVNIILGETLNWRSLHDISIKDAIENVLNYKDPWTDNN